MLTNAVNIEIETALHDNWKGGYGHHWVGINSPAQETNFRNIVETSYNNRKSIEENFGIKILLEGRNKGKYETLAHNQLLEPFILLAYEPISGGGTMFFISSSVQEVKIEDLKEDYKKPQKVK
ncbi:MAG: hypothetical protein LBF61_10420 [Azoarcus sp.]|nr:hypothetical protein [Azoarcus sp.]